MRPAFAFLIALGLCAAGCDRKPAGERRDTDQRPLAAAGPAAGSQAGVTPMAERVAILGLLNKRNGIVRDIALRPGQSVRVKDVVVRLRACETTAPW